MPLNSVILFSVEDVFFIHVNVHRGTIQAKLISKFQALHFQIIVPVYCYLGVKISSSVQK